MFIKDRRLRTQVIMFLVILSLTITNIANTVTQTNDYSHFRIIHLILFMALGMLLGAIISRLQNNYQKEETPKL